MGDGGMVKRLIIEKRKRVVATILGAAERDFLRTGKITREEYEGFRTTALLAIDAWHDLMLDILKISDEDMMRNEHAVDLLERVHAGQSQLSAQIRALQPEE